MGQDEKTQVYQAHLDGLPVLSVFTRSGHQMDHPIGEFTSMGRMLGNAGAQLEIASYVISKRHGKFGVVENHIFYKDVGSSNGTYLNGELCKDTVELQEDDLLTFFPRRTGPEAVDCVIWVGRIPEGSYYDWSEIDLTEDIAEIQIGRNLSGAGEETDQYLSRRHASFFHSENGWMILDLGSTNGVMVNGRKIQKYHALKPMDFIRVGSGCFLFLENRLVRGWLTAPYESTSDLYWGGDNLEIEIIEKNVWNRMKKKTLLKDVKLTIHPGEMVLILGGSGAGKTTFMNAVIGYESAEGTVRYGDLDIFQEYEQMKYEIGYVPQQDLLRMQDTVYNTLYAAAEMKVPRKTYSDEQSRTEWALGLMGLTKEKDTLVRKLSGGQRKRLSIAVELIGDPSLLFLDEPDSGLDGIMARTLMSNLRDIADMGKIVMVITHGPDRAADLFDKVMVLAKGTEDQCGHLAFYGPTKEALTYFNVTSLEGIVRKINREDEGGEGMADYFIEKWSSLKQ